MNKLKQQREIQKRVRTKLFPLLDEYGLDTRELDAVLKWKPLVLILGNYSSGKSTLVNELLGSEVQLTGQSPTDDSFTVLTAPNSGEAASIVSGTTLVNDENLPFTALKAFGDRLTSHFQMKLIDLALLENLAIVDTPGMLDSVTEKGRGYDYSGVVGEFARLADLVVLMFDPHKAGTIKETYTTIRTTLPVTSEEDRVVFVMSRVDECDNPADLIRSYGTLCWNLSQMTGRKDIPRIFLTFAPSVSKHGEPEEVWIDERSELKEKILAAPDLKISHILHLTDRKLFELKLVVEGMLQFAMNGRRLFRKSLKNGFLIGILCFFFLDLVLFTISGSAEKALLTSLFSGGATLSQLIIPIVGFLAALATATLWFVKWRLPGFKKRCLQDVDQLVRLETDFRRDTWQRVKEKVKTLIEKTDFKSLHHHHHKHLSSIDKFSQEELKKYFSKIRNTRQPVTEQEVSEEQPESTPEFST